MNSFEAAKQFISFYALFFLVLPALMVGAMELNYRRGKKNDKIN